MQHLFTGTVSWLFWIIHRLSLEQLSIKEIVARKAAYGVFCGLSRVSSTMFLERHVAAEHLKSNFFCALTNKNDILIT